MIIRLREAMRMWRDGRRAGARRKIFSPPAHACQEIARDTLAAREWFDGVSEHLQRTRFVSE
jgi:hypothetical protein